MFLMPGMIIALYTTGQLDKVSKAVVWQLVRQLQGHL